MYIVDESVETSNAIFFQFRILKGVLENINSLRGWCRKDYKGIYILWRQIIVKQNEFDGDLEFTLTIGFGGKSTSYWKSDRRQSWKWKGTCMAYKNPILKSNVS